MATLTDWDADWQLNALLFISLLKISRKRKQYSVFQKAIFYGQVRWKSIEWQESFNNLFFFSVMGRYRTRVSYWLSQSLTLRTELTDVTLVSEDTYWRLYRWDSGDWWYSWRWWYRWWLGCWSWRLTRWPTWWWPSWQIILSYWSLVSFQNCINMLSFSLLWYENYTCLMHPFGPNAKGEQKQYSFKLSIHYLNLICFCLIWWIWSSLQYQRWSIWDPRRMTKREIFQKTKGETFSSHIK